MASTSFHCPQCGKGIETNDENGAGSMECPYCGKSVPAPSGPPTSKIHCPGCSAKLEIQNDWMGTEITCPKCGKDIMLSEDMILIELKPKPKSVPPPAPLVRNVPPPAAARQEAEAEAGEEMPEEASAPSWSAPVCWAAAIFSRESSMTSSLPAGTGVCFRRHTGDSSPPELSAASHFVSSA